MGNLFAAVLDALFPSRCAGCFALQKNGNLLCASCFVQIPLHQTLHCASCDARLPDGKPICHTAMPYVLGAATSYHHDAVRTLIHHLKFKGAQKAALPLGTLLVRFLEKIEPRLSFDLVIPVPLGIRRERQRGFNQSALIASHVAFALALPHMPRALRRIRETAAQSEQTSRIEREANVAECFVADTHAYLAGKNILLIDDVATSGATLHAAASALKKAGVRRVIAVVAARA